MKIHNYRLKFLANTLATLLCMFATASATPLLSQASQAQVIPLNCGGNYLTVDIHVKGRSETLVFAVDTPAGASVIALAVAKNMGLVDTIYKLQIQGFNNQASRMVT
jgi:hypothetical protein